MYEKKKKAMCTLTLDECVISSKYPKRYLNERDNVEGTDVEWIEKFDFFRPIILPSKRVSNGIGLSIRGQLPVPFERVRRGSPWKTINDVPRDAKMRFA